MTTITAVERDRYVAIWRAVEHYGDHAPGEQWLPIFLDVVGTSRGTVLDAGCGSGKAGLALAAEGFDVTLCDLTDAGLVEDAKSLPFQTACLWQDLWQVARAKGHPNRQRFDYVYCCDVLEHIPPQFTMLAINQLLRVAAKGVFLSISLVPDNFGVWIGESLHHTVQPFTWWRDNLRELGDLVDARDCQIAGTFFVRPR
jgi:2-polyprenyl-3-methyl-5-hydroxy-6-metoxy-1,4-benzoquinol methylase